MYRSLLEVPSQVFLFSNLQYESFVAPSFLVYPWFKLHVPVLCIGLPWRFPLKFICFVSSYIHLIVLGVCHVHAIPVLCYVSQELSYSIKLLNCMLYGWLSADNNSLALAITLQLVSKKMHNNIYEVN